MHTLQIDRSHLAHCFWQETASEPLAEGQVRFAVQSFALSANNITYADLGESFRYWQFFPTHPGFGLLPIWGFAEVIESRHADFQMGQRAYGYWPLATEAVLTPKVTGKNNFVDSASHRASLPAVYQLYYRWQAPSVIEDEGRYALLRPLYMTSWLCSDFLRDHDCYGAAQIVLLSASSKTALALGAALQRGGVRAKRIGLTSAANVAFVQASQCYDEVLPYEALESMPKLATVSVDMAGNGELLRRVHQHFGATLRYSVSVGLSHRLGLSAGQGDFGEVQPILFFAPEHAKKRSLQFGQGWIETNSQQDWAQFLADTARYLPLMHAVGMDEIRAGYLELLAGRSPPTTGLVYTFHPASAAC